MRRWVKELTVVPETPYTSPCHCYLCCGTASLAEQVLHRGAIVHECYMNNMEQRTLHLSQSMAKSITSTVAGILIGEGKLDPAALVTRYLPELEETAWRGATLRHVLDMTTGVKFSESYEALDSDIARTDIACGWKPPPMGYAGPTTVWEQILGLKKALRAHGAAFDYRSIETDVLGHCIERVTGERLSQVTSRLLWQRLGVEESADWTVDPAGYALADAGFSACLRDYARFGLMLANGGVVNGQQVVPREFVDDISKCDPSLFKEPYTYTMPNGA